MRSKTKEILTTIILFFFAGLFEISGAYLVWLWLRESYNWIIGAVGGLILFLYGIVQTLQPANFGRVYAAYGGVFIAMAIVWGWLIDGIRPDQFDIIGGLIGLFGVSIIFYWPRKGEKK